MKDNNYFNGQRKRRLLAEIQEREAREQQKKRLAEQREAMKAKPYGLPSEAGK